MIRRRPRRRASSIASRLYTRVLLLIMSVGLVMAATTFWIARRHIYAEADAELVIASNVLYALMQDELAERRSGAGVLSVDDSLLSGEDLRAFRTSANWRMFTVSQNGRQILRSDTVPVGSAIARRPGFITERVGGKQWRIYGLLVPRSHLLIQVGERLMVRDRLIASVAGSLAIPLLLLIAGSAALLWLSLFDGLVHLRRLIAALAGRAPRDTHRFGQDDWPSDLAPLIATLNALFERVDAALLRERQFTDDAAHQLRTPLATLRLQLQSLGDDDAAAGAIATVDRATDLVSQMLTLAQLDGGRPAPGRIAVDDLLRDRIADQALFAARKDVSLVFDGDDAAIRGDAVIRGDAMALDLAIANLLENAIKHAPAGTTVTIGLTGADPGAVVVTIADQGCGIPAAERDAVFVRFHRGTRDTTGAGLGLAIVASAIALMQADLALADAPGGGLLVRIAIPRDILSFASA